MADLDPKPSPKQTKPTPVEWIGWVLRPTPRGWEYVRVSLPESVMLKHAVGKVNPPNTRQLLSASIERDLCSDRLVDRRGWERGK